MTDRASVRGVKNGRRNRKRRPTQSMIEARGRTLMRIAKVAGVIAALGAISFGVERFHHLALTSSRFAVAEIEVKGSHRATKESIVRLSGIGIGENIFTISTDEVAKTIEAHPWVKSAKVTRRYPKAIDIELVEHEPAVLVALGHLYYANADGEIVKRYTPGEKEPLPVVTGLARNEMETDDGEARARLRSAIAFIADLRAVLKEAAPTIAEIHLDPALGLSFVATGDDTTVLVGQPPWKQSIERLVLVKEALAKRGVHASRIMLGGERRPDRAVARLSTAEPSTLPVTGELSPPSGLRSQGSLRAPLASTGAITIEGAGAALVLME